MKRGNFFPGLSHKTGGREKKLIGDGAGAVTISDREDAALCGRRIGLFYLAKEARCGKLPIHGLVGWIGVIRECLDIGVRERSRRPRRS